MKRFSLLSLALLTLSAPSVEALVAPDRVSDDGSYSGGGYPVKTIPTTSTPSVSSDAPPASSAAVVANTKENRQKWGDKFGVEIYLKMGQNVVPSANEITLTSGIKIPKGLSEAEARGTAGVKGKLFDSSFKLAEYTAGFDLDYKNIPAFCLHHSGNLIGITFINQVMKVDDINKVVQTDFVAKEAASKISAKEIYKKAPLMPTIRVPVAGFITLTIQAGFNGSIKFKPKPDIEAKQLKAGVMGSVETYAGAYAEGSLDLWLVRGGVGANLYILKGDSGVSSMLKVQEKVNEGYAKMMVTPISGQVYVYADVVSGYSLDLKRKWSRAATIDLFKFSAGYFAKNHRLW